jgi:hypothetical protein
VVDAVAAVVSGVVDEAVLVRVPATPSGRKILEEAVIPKLA